MKPVPFLLVDDLEENLLSLEGLLRRDDLLLLKARSGDQALELLLQHDVALALVDVQMPGLNGSDARQRAHPAHPDHLRHGGLRRWPTPFSRI
ncbi:two-component system response regulator [Rhizobium sp. Root482]|uniref:response regulator n=1 Tax=Rhizobium sp. Root482 TaxID=1736543 RepID=UPI001FCD7456|nr:response regulator [Rhizobium sp. Root482]